MKKYTLLFGFLLSVWSCQTSQEIEPNAPVPAETISAESQWQTYQSLEQALGVVNQSLSSLYQEIRKGSGEKSLGAEFPCGSFFFFVNSQENPVPGFGSYDFYNSLTLQFGEPDCPNDFLKNGSIELYFGGLLENRWKDSLVLNQIQLADQTTLSAYRSSTVLPELSESGSEVFQVLTGADITLSGGERYALTLKEQITYQHRFTAEEIQTRVVEAEIQDFNANLSFTVKTAQPLLSLARCNPPLAYPVSGRLDFENDLFFLNFSIDYGDGTCDNQALLIPFIGNPVEIDL